MIFYIYFFNEHIGLNLFYAFLFLLTVFLFTNYPKYFFLLFRLDTYPFNIKVTYVFFVKRLILVKSVSILVTA